MVGPPVSEPPNNELEGRVPFQSANTNVAVCLAWEGRHKQYSWSLATRDGWAGASASLASRSAIAVVVKKKHKRGHLRDKVSLTWDTGDRKMTQFTKHLPCKHEEVL